jgi:site-specific DNA-methyltransferase (adenine-specific)
MDISTNIVYNDDCLNVMRRLPDKCIDMVCVDLPYGQTELHWDIPIDLEEMWKELNRICKETACMTFFTTVKYGNTLINSNPKMFRYDLVMPKNIAVGFLNANRQPLRGHEMVYVFYKKQPTYNPQKTEGKPYSMPSRVAENTSVYGEFKDRTAIQNNGDRYPTSVLPTYKVEKVKNGHNTKKSVKTCEWLVKSYSNEGDVVLDFTCGSGSALQACINTNRKYIGVEKDATIYGHCIDNLRSDS